MLHRGETPRRAMVISQPTNWNLLSSNKIPQTQHAGCCPPSRTHRGTPQCSQPHPTSLPYQDAPAEKKSGLPPRASWFLLKCLCKCIHMFYVYTCILVHMCSCINTCVCSKVPFVQHTCSVSDANSQAWDTVYFGHGLSRGQ